MFSNCEEYILNWLLITPWFITTIELMVSDLTFFTWLGTLIATQQESWGNLPVDQVVDITGVTP